MDGASLAEIGKQKFDLKNILLEPLLTTKMDTMCCAFSMHNIYFSEFIGKWTADKHFQLFAADFFFFSR